MSDISSTPLLQALPFYWDHFYFGSFWFDVLLQNVVIVLGNFVVYLTLTLTCVILNWNIGILD